ncbi:MAG: Dabb family protein [Paracoccaceae bacterium]|nr:Dabb family protein [Paracoccaceae bacterium]
MLAHCVFLNFAESHDTNSRMSVLSALGELVDEVDGMLSFHYGPNLDFEAKTPNHSDGFIVFFRDREAHLAYERHPKHVALGARLVSMCVGGAEGILVYDIDCQ